MDAKDTIQIDSTLHAYPGYGEADQAGSFYFSPIARPNLSDVVDGMGANIDFADFASSDIAKLFSEIGPFRLQRFASCLSKHDEGSFVSLVCVLDAIKLNEEISSLVFKMISCVELSVRAVLCRFLYDEYGPLALHNSEAFRHESQYLALRRSLHREADQGKRNRYPITADHLMVSGQYPIWVEMELMSFGLLSKIFGNLASDSLSRKISRQYGLRPNYLANWLRYLTQIRNMCAHHQPLFGCYLNMVPRLFPENNDCDKHRLFPAFVVMLHMIDRVDQGKANYFRLLLSKILESHSQTGHGALGFPEDWRERLSIPSEADHPRTRGKRGGRPAANSEAVQKALFLYDKKEMTVAQIAEETGISQATIFNYLRKRKNALAQNAGGFRDYEYQHIEI